MKPDFNAVYEKQPIEQETLRIEWAERAACLVVSGYVMSSAEVKVFDGAGTDVSVTMIAGAVTIDAINQYIYITIKAGTDGTDYSARVRATYIKAGQPDQVQEGDLTIRVKQRGY